MSLDPFEPVTNYTPPRRGAQTRPGGPGATGLDCCGSLFSRRPARAGGNLNDTGLGRGAAPAARGYTLFMVFTKRLRDGVRRGEITCSVRIWTRPHVRAGGRYRMEEGEIVVDSIEPIGFPDITPELARASGFLGVLDLLKVAKHGRGENIYLVRFHYEGPGG